MSDVEVRRLGPDDWQLARTIRLRALREAPYAFGSTLQRESSFDEDNWRARLGRSAWFVTFATGEPIGVAVGIVDDDVPRAMQLVSMWVDPGWRGTGVAARLVEQVVAWTAEQAAPELGLWVADGNDRARRLYERLGFVATGERQPLPSNPSVGEARLVRGVRDQAF